MLAKKEHMVQRVSQQHYKTVEKSCYLDYHLKRKSIVHKVLKKDQYKGKVYLQARQLFERFFQNIAMNAPTKQQFDYGHIQYHNILSEILKYVIQIAQSKRTNF